MVNDLKLQRDPNESIKEYQQRICNLRDALKLTWMQVAQICNEELGVMHDESYYRKGFSKPQVSAEDIIAKTMEKSIDSTTAYRTNRSEKDYDIPSVEKAINDEEDDEVAAELRRMIEKKKLKIREREENNRFNSFVRNRAREEHIKNIVLDYADAVASRRALPTIKPIVPTNTDKEALLLLGDWHYGMEHYNNFNSYNPDITRERVAVIRDKAIAYCKQNKIEIINVLNMGDLISGQIHTAIKLQNRYNVVKQLLDISDILSDFIRCLAESGLKVRYYSVIDNHSRIDPNKDDAINVETYLPIIDHYITATVGNIAELHIDGSDNTIIRLNCLGHKIAAVHGDKDKLKSIVAGLSMHCNELLDLVCSAHIHHFAGDEQGGCKVIVNPSLMGNDEYADNHRYRSNPAQLLIVVTKDDVVDDIKFLTAPYNK